MIIKDSPIVEDTRRVRRMISEKFDHDIGRYIAYLQREAASRQAKKRIQCSDGSGNRIADAENHEQTGKENRTN